MIRLMYDFFYNNVFGFNTSDALNTRFMTASTFSIGGVNYTLAQWLTFICSFVAIGFIVVLCCLFVYKIIKLIGGLITR